MNGGTIRGTALSMDSTARPWMGRFHEWDRSNLSNISTTLVMSDLAAK
jgi:hypothetical protein